MTGTIVKAVSGFYYVAAEGGRVYECKARGVFKNRGITPLVGDDALFEYDEAHESGLVTEILERKNSFDRPPLANVDLLVIVMAVANPDPSFEILDRFLVTAEQKNVKALICVNKCDIAKSETLDAFSEYKSIYPVCFVSAKTGDGTDSLKACLTGMKAALAGPSGVGKSSLTNLLLGRSESETGDISRKSLRGKNTTRHTQLFAADGFMLFDTPGFTSFDASLDEDTELDRLFPEMRPYIGSCRFDDCRHLKEPGCAVTEALSEGKISQRRYKSYTQLYDAIINLKKY